MENKINYLFDDEVVSKFSYDMNNKRIEVSFTGYYDILKNKYIKNDCIFIIENWLDAKSKIDEETRFEKLDKYIGIFSMLLFVEKKDTDLKLYVNTIDERYMTLFFMQPKISFEFPM